MHQGDCQSSSEIGRRSLISNFETMSDPVTTVENLSKRYVITRQRSRDEGFRHVLQDAAMAAWRWLRKADGHGLIQTIGLEDTT